MLKNNPLRQTYAQLLAETHELGCLLVRALPHFCFISESIELSEVFERHQRETWMQLDRLETLLKKVEPRPISTGCKEARKLINEADDARSTDLLRIAAARRIERFQIDAYEMLVAYAEMLGDSEAVELLTKSLKEEKSAEAKLMKLYRTLSETPREGADTLLLFLLGADS